MRLLRRFIRETVVKLDDYRPRASKASLLKDFWASADEKSAWTNHWLSHSKNLSKRSIAGFEGPDFQVTFILLMALIICGM